MKKIGIVVPVLLCAVMVMMGCPSEPDAPPPSQTPIDEPDFTLIDGKLIIPLTIIPMTDGGEYDVILDIAAVEDPLLGCHFKGRLLYIHEGTTYLLAAAQDAFPNAIAKFPRKYRWTFRAGDYGDEGGADSTQWGYKVPADKTIPAGAMPVFQLFAMTPKWKYFGDSDAEKYTWQRPSKEVDETDEIDYKKADIKCGIKAPLPVFRAKPVVNWTAGDTVLSNGGSEASATGKGNIEGDEWEKVKNASPTSILRFNCTVKVGEVDSGAREPGWGFGGVGGNVNGEFPKVRDIDQYLSLLIPKGTPAGSQTFDIDIFVEDIIASSNKDWSFVNTNDTNTSNQKINSITIYTQP
jgi:hypothetical protein